MKPYKDYIINNNKLYKVSVNKLYVIYNIYRGIYNIYISSNFYICYAEVYLLGLFGGDELPLHSPFCPVFTGILTSQQVHVSQLLKT